MKVQWARAAADDMVALRQYIAQDNPQAAYKVGLRILASVKQLSLQPGMGRAGRVPRTRELVVPSAPYLVIYRVELSVLQVLRVLHQARKWPPR